MLLLAEANRLRLEARRALAADELARAREYAARAQELVASRAGERLVKVLGWLELNTCPDGA